MGPLLVLTLLRTSPPAAALPAGPGLFCDAYPEAPACAAGPVSCTVCHALSGPPGHNPYGAAVAAWLGPEADFVAELPAALAAVEPDDADGDGVDNLTEILAGTEPGWTATEEPECAEQVQLDNGAWSVGRYDPAFAWKRVLIDVCGRQPRYDEVQAFRAESGGRAAVAAALDACLQSPHWGQVLEELAVDVVEPVGPDTDVNILGNWRWDLRLFRWVMSGDRDAGEVMTADYVVVEAPEGSGRVEAVAYPAGALQAYANPLEPAYRYGLLTTRYSLAMRVMFADVPRTFAAHYYRKLLGLDLARSEGLFPVDETPGAYPWPAPADVDEKGVWQQECASCHSTLDALSYPWARYNGIDLEGDTTGTFQPDRATGTMPTTAGAIFGVPVDGPDDWVRLAVASDAFSQQTVRRFWVRLFQRPPRSCELDAFDGLWMDFRDGGRNVEQMLHAMVQLDAWGAP